jgi:hypothetical protein
MLRDKLWTTGVGFFGLVLIILISRGMDQLLPAEFLAFTHPTTVVLICVIIILMAKQWIPRGKR